jgi:Flp pilus assembly protein TadG
MRPIRTLGRVVAGFNALLRDRSGATAVEMGLIAPILFAFLLGIAQFGYTFWLQNALDYSVTAAARCASVNTTTCDNVADTQAYAAGVSGAGFASTVFTATLATTCGGKNGNLVSGSYAYSFVIPFVDLSMTLTSQACYPMGSP